MAEVGADFRIEIEDFESAELVKPFVPIEDITSFDRNKARSTTSTAVFHRATPRRTRGTRDTSFSLGGLLNLNDPGQMLLRKAETDDLNVNLRILPDGVNGFEQVCQVNTTGLRATPEGFQETTWECAAMEEAVDVGVGTNL